MSAYIKKFTLVNPTTRPVVLIVTHGFPPYIRSLGGAIRMLMLAQFLQANNCDVRVVCAKGQLVDTFGYDDLLASLAIDYVDDPLARQASRSFAAAPQSSAVVSPGALQRLKRMLKNLLLEVLTPDTGITASRAMQGAIAAIVARHPGLTLISSGPPHSAHLLGMVAKRAAPGIQWIVDYRDSWNGTPLFRKRLRLLQWLNRRYEARVLDACDHFTFVSKPILHNAGAASASELGRKSTLVMNGFDAGVLAGFGCAPLSGGPARIGYFGAISNAPGSYRDPSILLEVLAASPQLNVVLELYGAIEIQGDWQARLGSRIVIGPQLTHAEAVRKMSEMDALMLLHTREEGAAEVVTGKVFEYIASGRPIISVGPQEMAVNELLQGDSSAHCVSHRDRAALLAVLSAVAAAKGSGRQDVRSADRIAGFTRNAQYQHILDLVVAHAGAARAAT